MNWNELVESGKDLTEKEKEELQIYTNDIDTGLWSKSIGATKATLVFDKNDSSKNVKAILV
jgi:hypothetical protein